MIGTEEVRVFHGARDTSGLANRDAGEAASTLTDDHSPIRPIVQVF
jgi:hypothetical protein